MTRGFYDLGLCRGKDHYSATGLVFENTASMLFGVEGLHLADAEAGLGGTVTVRAVTGS
jgi:hypothetical protein